ncbi:DUF2213 domain-containing protein [Brevibacillus reuszeri]|uniref:DUF2213 domain-containing protein n=1 Tax=Brevibacillus reuszeri TaxID=54915 RepID=UPI001BB316FB|nr:DUF2213 domain-containing protein [Brevibacillus reuszeri]
MRNIRRAYYGSRFSKNMTATPEGFLICHNVPIARTGWYDYLGKEIGAEDKHDELVKVYRSPEEVFSPAAIASFEGKVLTDEHPNEPVTPINALRYTKGVIQNVRRGTGEDDSFLMADLVVYDQNLINEIQEGKREVSCGYDCVYEAMKDGTYHQRQICGNHVAVVNSGRAGDRVAIQDSKSQSLGNTQNPKGDTSMPGTDQKIVLPKKSQQNLKITNFLAAVGLKYFAKDANPEDVQDAVEAMVEERGVADNQPPEPASEPAADSQDPAVAALADQVAKLTELVTGLVQSNASKDEKPEDAIDNAIAELEKASGSEAADDEEESHTVPVENMDEEGPVTNPADRPESVMTGDNAYKIQALKAMKPILAAIPDPVQRKRAADAAVASLGAKPSRNAYATIAKNQRKPANDSKPPVDHSQLGREIAKKHNPHYKEQA